MNQQEEAIQPKYFCASLINHLLFLFKDGLLLVLVNPFCQVDLSGPCAFYHLIPEPGLHLWIQWLQSKGILYLVVCLHLPLWFYDLRWSAGWGSNGVQVKRSWCLSTNLLLVCLILWMFWDLKGSWEVKKIPVRASQRPSQ